tara:strand:- start:121 stop:924 length:804 start_codon:yes stop_codon:yes gene_type:complete
MTEMNKNIGVMVQQVDDFTDMPNTPSLDLPPQIQSLVDMPEETFNTPMYQEGGMVQPAGMQMQSQGPRSGQALDMEVSQTMKNNPEVLARIRAGIEAGLQTGELSIEELNMAVELAKVVLQNPAMYPQIRQFAIQKGLATEQDLPVEYDEGLIIALITAGKAMEADIQFQPVQQMKDGGQLEEIPQGNMGLAKLPESVRNKMGYLQDGGVLKGPAHSDGGIPVKVAGVNNAEMEGGEYVIPKKVVMAKGTEFFDRMLANYEDKPDVT